MPNLSVLGPGQVSEFDPTIGNFYYLVRPTKKPVGDREREVLLSASIDTMGWLHSGGRVSPVAVQCVAASKFHKFITGRDFVSNARHRSTNAPNYYLLGGTAHLQK